MELPEPAAVLVSILVIATFIFLLRLARGSLSERQQTAGWIVFGILFFSVCSFFFRSQTVAVGARPQPASSMVVGGISAGLHR
jgi:hypothetical protein